MKGTHKGRPYLNLEASRDSYPIQFNCPGGDGRDDCIPIGQSREGLDFWGKVGRKTPRYRTKDGMQSEIFGGFLKLRAV